MRKIGLIVGANIEYAPYVQNYLKIIKRHNIKYKIIEYKKINLDSDNNNVISFQEKKERSNLFQKLIGYYKFINFVKKKYYKKNFHFL